MKAGEKWRVSEWVAELGGLGGYIAYAYRLGSRMSASDMFRIHDPHPDVRFAVGYTRLLALANVAFKVQRELDEVSQPVVSEILRSISTKKGK